MNKLEIDDNSAWKVVRAVTRTKTITPPLYHPTTPNEYVYDPQKKCELLADTLCTSFQPNPVTAENASHAKEVDDFAISIQQHRRCRIHKYKWPQIQNIIKNLKNRKAPGNDNITNEMLNMLPLSAIKYLTNINKALKTEYFLTCWKLAKVIVIPKVGKKDPTFLDNYRPISFLNTISNVAENAILLRISKFINTKEIIKLE
jgi:hypothetical protein